MDDKMKEKIYITLHLWGVDYIIPQSMKESISPFELFNTGQITP